LRFAKNIVDATAEIADLYEVIRSLTSTMGLDWDVIQHTADEKRASRGGFREGVVLIETAWQPRARAGRAKSREIPLASLARTMRLSRGTELNYIALLLNNSGHSVVLPSGTRLRIALTNSGVKIEELPPEPDQDEAQLSLLLLWLGPPVPTA
jgi:hypothetical protein